MSKVLPEFSRHARELNMDGLTRRRNIDGTSRTTIDLPSPDTKRWGVRRKAAVVTAMRSGAIDLEEACRRYELSEEEFLAWERGIANHGVAGLRITRLQIYHHVSRLRQGKPRY